MRARGLLFPLGLLAFTAGGCAELIGLEQRERTEGVIDEQTNLVTSQLCVDYCDAVMTGCLNDNAVYPTRRACIDVCNHLPPGAEDDPTGNTIACRLNQARFADDGGPEEFCPSAGPSGGEACGGDCPAYCGLLEAACGEQFMALSDCTTACAALRNAGPFNVVDYQTGDSVQCRLTHVSSAFEDANLCARSAFLATDACLDEGAEQLPTCDAYCRNVMGACVGDLTQYESTRQCLAVCGSFTVGELRNEAGDPITSGNTVACRQYHAGAALSQPDVHCHHSGPTGNNFCDDDASPGSCDSYCKLRVDACNEGDFAACQTACKDNFSGDDATGKTYTVATAEETPLNCRFLYLSRAIDGDAMACEKTGVDVNVACP